MDEEIDKTEHFLTNKCLNDEELDENGPQNRPQNESNYVNQDISDTNQRQNDCQLTSDEENQAKTKSIEYMIESSDGRSGASREPFTYHLKWINWMSAKTPIVTQNVNGPCPLLAIINVLILKRRIQLPSMMDVITDDQLMEYLGDCILNSVPKVLFNT